MYSVYILESEQYNRYYIGHTEDLEKRVKQHNQGRVKSTKAYRPWRIVYQENFQTKSEAFRREMQIKSYRHGQAFKKLLKIS